MKDLVVSCLTATLNKRFTDCWIATRHCKFDTSSIGYLFILNAIRVSYSEVHPYSPRLTL